MHTHDPSSSRCVWLCGLSDSTQIEQARATLAAHKRRRELDGDSDDDAVDAGEGRRDDVTMHGRSMGMMGVGGSMGTAAGIAAAAGAGEESPSNSNSDSDDDLGRLGGNLSSLWDPPGLSTSPAHATTSTPLTPAPAPAAPLAQLPPRFGGGGGAMATGADSSSDSSSSDSDSD